MQRSNPKYIGPGYWASWHIKTLLTDNKEKKLLLKKLSKFGE